MPIAPYAAQLTVGELCTPTTLTANGTISAGPTRVKAVQAAFSAAGTVVLSDGGGSLLTLAGRVNETTDTIVPGGGVAFNTNCTAGLTNVASLTVFHVPGNAT